MEDNVLLEYEKLIPLRIGNVECHVPENNSLLRCFQYLRPYPISMGGFCWNDDCHTCEVVIRRDSGPEEKVFACQTEMVPGMTVLELSEKLKFCLKDFVKSPDRT